MKNKLGFKTEDFDLWYDGDNEYVARRANDLLERQLSGFQMFYSNIDRAWDGLRANKSDDSTHQGLWVNIEPIEKPKCEHEAVGVSPNFDFSPGCAVLITEWKCSKCGVKLKPKREWEEVK